jgi:hypothetical protein
LNIHINNNKKSYNRYNRFDELLKTGDAREEGY